MTPLVLCVIFVAIFLIILPIIIPTKEQRAREEEARRLEKEASSKRARYLLSFPTIKWPNDHHKSFVIFRNAGTKLANNNHAIEKAVAFCNRHLGEGRGPKPDYLHYFGVQPLWYDKTDDGSVCQISALTWPSGVVEMNLEEFVLACDGDPDTFLRD